MVINLLVLGRFQASSLVLVREVVREVRCGEQRILTHHVTRNQSATAGTQCLRVICGKQMA
jgi:hypothetical protein